LKIIPTRRLVTNDFIRFDTVFIICDFLCLYSVCKSLFDQYAPRWVTVVKNYLVNRKYSTTDSWCYMKFITLQNYKIDNFNHLNTYLVRRLLLVGPTLQAGATDASPDPFCYVFRLCRVNVASCRKWRTSPLTAISFWNNKTTDSTDNWCSSFHYYYVCYENFNFTNEKKKYKSSKSFRSVWRKYRCVWFPHRKSTPAIGLDFLLWKEELHICHRRPIMTSARRN
jgi:hypothetical protein